MSFISSRELKCATAMCKIGTRPADERRGGNMLKTRQSIVDGMCSSLHLVKTYICIPGAYYCKFSIPWTYHQKSLSRDKKYVLDETVFRALPACKSDFDRDHVEKSFNTKQNREEIEESVAAHYRCRNCSRTEGRYV